MVGAESSGKPEPEMTEHKCPVCESPMVKRMGRFGPFLGCSDYPKCKTIVNLDKEGNPKWPAPGEAKQIGVKKAATAKAPATKAPATKAAAAKAPAKTTTRKKAAA